MHDISDLHRIKWTATPPLPTLQSFIISKFPITLPITAILGFLSWQLDTSQSQIVRGEIFTLIFLYFLIYMLVVNIIWYSVNKSLNHPQTYSVSSGGITIGNTNLDWKKIKKFQIQPQDVTLTTIFKHYHLYNPPSTQQITKSLDHYISQTKID